jgi:hypothetical protein
MPTTRASRAPGHWPWTSKFLLFPLSPLLTYSQIVEVHVPPMSTPLRRFRPAFGGLTPGAGSVRRAAAPAASSFGLVVEFVTQKLLFLELSHSSFLIHLSTFGLPNQIFIHRRLSRAGAQYPFDPCETPCFSFNLLSISHHYGALSPCLFLLSLLPHHCSPRCLPVAHEILSYQASHLPYIELVQYFPRGY